MSNATDIPLIPAGECFKASTQTNQNMFLWGNYMDIHPNTKGSYLAACAFYNALFKQPIINTSILAGLTDADATYLRNQAETITLNNLSDWFIDDFTPTANFDYTISNNSTLNFTNSSTNFDELLWDFGDGATSILENPSHLFDFSTEDSYTIINSIEEL